MFESIANLKHCAIAGQLICHHLTFAYKLNFMDVIVCFRQWTRCDNIVCVCAGAFENVMTWE